MIVHTGFGAVGPTAQQAIGVAYSAGAGVATPAIAGTGTAAAAVLGAAAVPLVGAAFAGIFIGIEALLNSGCGQSCIITSNWANQAESLLKQNLQAYLALPAPRAQSAQAAYLENFDKVWAYLYEECSNPQLGTAGKNCIADRQEGGCKWRTSPGGWSGTTYMAPGPAGSGQACWSWWTGYRDPIADDPNVVEDSAASTSTVPEFFASSVAGVSPWLVAGLALLAIGLGAMSQ